MCVCVCVCVYVCVCVCVRVCTCNSLNRENEVYMESASGFLVLDTITLPNT